MKRFILLVVVALTFGLLSNSYALPNFWYVGVGSNLSGQLTPNTSVNVKITVKQNGLTVFQESHAAVMTDDFSIFAVEVGNGTPITGTLGALTMTANTQFLCEVSVPPAAYKTIATTSLAYLYSTLIIVPGAISITQDNILMGDPMNNAADVPVGGDLTATYNAGTADFQIAAGAIVNADVNAAAAIDVTKLAAGAANQFLVNNGTNAWAGLNLSGNFVGDAVGTALDLSNTGVTPGTYGSASNVSQITVDAFGRITAANDVAIIESDPEVNMTTVNAVPVWNGTALVDGNITDDGIVVDLNGRDLNTTGTIYAGAGDYTGNVEALTLTQNGNAVVDVTTAFGGDVTGTIGATVVGDDSHNHTDATIADALTINGGTINNSPIGATTPSTGAFTTLTQGGNNVVDVTTAFVGDVTGTIGATVVGDDSHNHTDATIADNLTINGGTVSNSTITVADNVFTIQDNGDNTKQAQFELSGITTATTRTYTLPDANGTILLNGDIGVTVQPYNANTTILGSDIDLTSEVTGTLPIANGGTGATTANAALNNLLPTQAGNAGEFLTTDGTNTSWAPLTVTLQAAYDGGNTITGTNTIAITNSDAINTAVGISSNNTGATSGYALNVGHAGNRPAARVYYAGLGNASQTAPVLVVDQGNPATGIKVNLNDNNLTDASGGSYGVDIVYNPGDASNTGAGIRVVVGDALNGIDVDAQGTGLAINVVDEGGAVKLSYASNNATTIPNDVSVYHSTINSNSTITMPSGTNGKFLYVVHTGAGNLTFSGVKTDGTNYTTTDEANLTFVYAGGAWQLVSVVE